MTYAIVYSSQTGNTELLAKRLRAILPDSQLLYYGTPDGAAQEADFIFMGFWTDKGSSDQPASDFLKTLQNKRVFLFGTAGFGGSEAYFSQILSRVSENLDSSNIMVDGYMCQGKMPLSVRQRYASMQTLPPEKIQELIDNYDRALPHPDEADLEKLELAAIKHIK